MRPAAMCISRLLNFCHEDENTDCCDLLQSGLTMPRDTGALVEDGCCQGAGQGGCSFRPEAAAQHQAGVHWVCLDAFEPLVVSGSPCAQACAGM